MRKDRILAIARETLGEAWAQAEAKQKKAEIAKAMQDAFAHGDDVPAGVTAEGRAAAIAWTPPGFRAFDTGTVDDERRGEMTRGQPPPNRNRLTASTRRWAMRRKMMAMTPTVAPIHRAPTATPRNPGLRRPVRWRTMTPIPLRWRHSSP